MKSHDFENPIIDVYFSIAMLLSNLLMTFAQGQLIYKIGSSGLSVLVVRILTLYSVVWSSIPDTECLFQENIFNNRIYVL